MKKKSISELIGRVFRRSENPLVGRVYAAMGRPMLAHPTLGEAVIFGLLQGATLDGGSEPIAKSQPIAGRATQSKIIVLNITGPMVSRPEPGECGPGPVSYEAIWRAFDAALDDDAVTAIVFRMDTPGGYASKCFDLVDHIYESRGKKPIRAQVDDMAYSGGYAIASACDSIQVSRTSGVGSVGVVSYHVDQSGFDEQVGVKFTYIFSGDHKVDGNPHEPLPTDVMEAWKSESDELRDLFVATVARNRGMSSQAVFDTQADTYLGENGVAVGFADSVGTLDDLLAELAAPAKPEAPPAPSDNPSEEEVIMSTSTTKPGGVTNPAETQEEKDARIAAEKKTKDDADAKAQADRAGAELNAMIAALSAAVTSASQEKKVSPDVAIAILNKGPIKGVSATDQVSNAMAIADACSAAKLSDQAGDYIARGLTIDEVRKQLAGAVATPPNQEVSNARQDMGGAGNIHKRAVSKLKAEHDRRVQNNPLYRTRSR
jgi:signal peptide peptidase SppA